MTRHRFPGRSSLRRFALETLKFLIVFVICLTAFAYLFITICEALIHGY